MEDMPWIEIPLHGKYGKGKYTRVDGDYDGEYFSQFKWYLSNNGYPIRRDGHGVKGRKLVLLHHEVLRTDKARVGHIVRDHIDGDKLNNRSCNLRLVSQSENLANRNLPTHCKKGHEYVGDNLYLYNNARYCKGCRKIYNKLYNKQKYTCKN